MRVSKIQSKTNRKNNMKSEEIGSKTKQFMLKRVFGGADNQKVRKNQGTEAQLEYRQFPMI